MSRTCGAGCAGIIDREVKKAIQHGSLGRGNSRLRGGQRRTTGDELALALAHTAPSIPLL